MYNKYLQYSYCALKKKKSFHGHPEQDNTHKIRATHNEYLGVYSRTTDIYMYLYNVYIDVMVFVNKPIYITYTKLIKSLITFLGQSWK